MILNEGKPVKKQTLTKIAMLIAATAAMNVSAADLTSVTKTAIEKIILKYKHNGLGSLKQQQIKNKHVQDIYHP